MLSRGFLGGEAEAVFDFDVVHVERNAQKLRGETFGGDAEHPVKLMGLHRCTVMQNVVNPCPARQQMHEECFRSYGIIRVVHILMFVVFGEYGVVDCEFCEHSVIHNVSRQISPSRPLAIVRSSPR